MPDPFIPISLEDYFTTTAQGSVEKALTNTVYGINHRLINPRLEQNKDHTGMVFITRPQLNLSSGNLRAVRKYYKLLNNDPKSVERMIRVTLDPSLPYDLYGGGEITSSLVDPLQAFIPLVTNTAKSVSGWPDIAIPTYVSPAGNYKQQYSQVDGISENYEAWTTDISFKNTGMNILLYMFYIWSTYQTYVFEGKLLPYPNAIRYNYIDYMTRIYRVVLDKTQSRVTMIAASGVSYPINAPLGMFFDFNSDTPYNQQIKEFTIRFQSLGAIYMDDILVYEFNKTVSTFNKNMTDDVREQAMVKLTGRWADVFNNRGYPRIDPDTMAFEWWVPRDIFETKELIVLGSGL